MISTHIISPYTGVPVKLVVNEVIACASPVIVKISPLSVLIVGVADWVVETTRLVILLFVSVSTHVKLAFRASASNTPLLWTAFALPLVGTASISAIFTTLCANRMVENQSIVTVPATLEACIRTFIRTGSPTDAPVMSISTFSGTVSFVPAMISTGAVTDTSTAAVSASYNSNVTLRVAPLPTRLNVIELRKLYVPSTLKLISFVPSSKIAVFEDATSFVHVRSRNADGSSGIVTGVELEKLAEAPDRLAIAVACASCIA